jgi:hypothetical protein
MLRAIRFLDDCVANPAYVLVATFGLDSYAPTLRRQIQVLG